MIHRARVASGEDGGWVVGLRAFSWHLSARVIEVLLDGLDGQSPPVRVVLCTGLTRAELAALRARFWTHPTTEGWGEEHLTARELHGVHAALLAVRAKVPSEARFWEATGGRAGGFYREEAAALAAELARAVGAATGTGPASR